MLRLPSAGATPAYAPPGAGPGSYTSTAWCEGIITHANADGTYSVRVTSTAQDLQRVPRIHANASDDELIPEGTTVLLNTGLPMGAYVLGIIKLNNTPFSPIAPTSTPDVPDKIAGDRRIEGPEGNVVAVLADGTNVLKSASNAQLITYPNGHVDLLAGTFRQITAFGESSVTSDGTSVNYSLRAGTSVQAHTGMGLRDSWTLRIDAGADGDLLRVRVTTPKNDDLSRWRMRSNGSVETFARGGRVDQIFTGDTRVVVGPDTTQVTGPSSLKVTGTRTTDLGSRKDEVVGADDQLVGGVQTVAVGAERYVSVLGTQSHHVQGTCTSDVLGDYQRVVAAVTRGGVPKGQGMAWINYGGGMSFVVQPTAIGGSFNVVTTLPASVNLGVTGAAVYNPLTGKHDITAVPGPYAAVLYEPLLAFLQALLLWMDTHVHATLGTPAPVPASSVVSGMLPTFRSTRVTIGL